MRQQLPLSGLFVSGELRALPQLHVKELGSGGGVLDKALPVHACAVGARVAHRAEVLRAEEGQRVQLGAAEETIAELRPRPLGRRGIDLGGGYGLRVNLQQAEPSRHRRPDHRHARALQEERRRQVQGLRVRRTEVSSIPRRASNPNSELNA